MAIILDADVIIGGEKGTFALAEWLRSKPEENFEVAAITIAELWHGVERASGNRRTRRSEYLQAMISSLTIIPYTEQIAYEHARIWAHLESAGKMISPYDIIVAATALKCGSALATFNKKHFELVPTLTILEPS